MWSPEAELILADLHGFGGPDGAVQLAVHRVPAGYTKERPLILNGRPYIGGEVIPNDELAAASPADQKRATTPPGQSGNRFPLRTVGDHDLGPESGGRQGGSGGHAGAPGRRVTREVLFDYSDPTGSLPGAYAQCRTCRMWTGDDNQTCTIMGPQVPVTGLMSCNYYVEGVPDVARAGKEEALVTPTIAVLVDRQVRCENCRWLEAESSECHLFETMNEMHGDVVDLKEKVDRNGCCTAQQPRRAEDKAPDAQLSHNGAITIDHERVREMLRSSRPVLPVRGVDNQVIAQLSGALERLSRQPVATPSALPNMAINLPDKLEMVAPAVYVNNDQVAAALLSLSDQYRALVERLGVHPEPVPAVFQPNNQIDVGIDLTALIAEVRQMSLDVAKSINQRRDVVRNVVDVGPLTEQVTRLAGEFGKQQMSISSEYGRLTAVLEKLLAAVLKPQISRLKYDDNNERVVEIIKE